MGSLKNQILISMPHMIDPIFSKSVVYICAHDKKGAMGLIINKKIKDHDKSLVNYKDFELNPKSYSTLYFGGPVSMKNGIVLHHKTYRNSDALKVSDTIAITNKQKTLEKIINKKSTAFKLMLGHCGWIPNQLEKEIERGDWFIQNTTDDFVFNFPSKQMWEHATFSLGVDSESFFVNHGIS
tara:strand:- start:4314 stop:4859 length:546 start_codon:yes stop_codon:yes gene_type:complete